MRLYLSSTLADLQEERAAVKDALGGDFAVVESYEVDPRPLWKSCIDDVAKCRIYVGIAGLGYASRETWARPSW